MIQKKHRFHGRTAVIRVYRLGRSTSYGPIRLWYKEGSINKIAVVVSKKVAKSAVKRNRIRRRVYELYRTTIFSELVAQYEAVIGVYSDSVADMSSSELELLLLGCFEKSGLINNTKTNP